MPHIVLYQPEIPPNTGNIIRLCANTGFQLHLIRPLGFAFDDKRMRRAGLDYHEWAQVRIHNNYQAFLDNEQPERLFAIETQGTQRYDQITYQPDDYLLFGPETRGLPTELMSQLDRENIVRLPMRENSRSLNLSNSVAVCVYEVWRQTNFVGGL